MRFNELVRSTARRTVEGLSRRTIFSSRRSARKLGFHALGAGQELVVCSRPAGETFVVFSRDEIIGRELFVQGHFDFDKFSAAHELLVNYRSGVKPEILLDVGANIGSICIPAVSRGYFDQAIAIEPDPRNCRLLRANIELNDLGGRIIVHESAAGSEDEQTLELILSEFNFGDHRIGGSNGATGGSPQVSGRTISIVSNRIDTLCRAFSDRDVLLWVDVQGYEGLALRGARGFLARQRPIVLEFWPDVMATHKSYPLLRDAVAHYAGFWDLLNPDSLRPISELDALHDRMSGNSGSTDILLV